MEDWLCHFWGGKRVRYILTQDSFFRQLEQSGIHLNAEQKRAVCHREGPLVVFAGPGSGKTTVLTCRAAYLLEVCGVAPKELLIVTFTRAAAEEMRQRLAQLPGIGEERAKACEMGTFHSVFLRILLRYYGTVPKLMEEKEQRHLLRQILRESGADCSDEEIADLLQKIGLCKNNLIWPERIQAKKKENRLFRERFSLYEQEKRARGWWDFDDILLECHRLLCTQPHILEEYRQKYRYILVDEFQDTNWAQYEVLRLLAAHRNLSIVGDDDQAIYRFRGSRAELLLDFERNFAGTTKVVLAHNYRSTEAIIAASRRLIEHNRKRQRKDFRGRGVTGESPRVIRPENEAEEAAWILDDIEQNYKQGIHLEEHAVLYRTNIQSQAFVDALVQRQIPFSLHDAEGDFYRLWQVRDLLAYLRFAQNPDDAGSLQQIINRPKRYMPQEGWLDRAWLLSREKGVSLLDSMQQLPGLEVYQKKKLQKLVQDIKKLEKLPPSRALDYIRKEIGYDAYLQEYAERTGNPLPLVLQPVEAFAQTAGAFNTIEGLLQHVANVQESVKQASQSSTGIQLMTFHRAKGLEFHSVYLIGLLHHLVPHERAVEERWREEAWEEERRLLYVGMTRAKERLLLFAPQRYQGKKAHPSPFLKETGLFSPEPPPFSLRQKLKRKGREIQQDDPLRLSPQERLQQAIRQYGHVTFSHQAVLVHKEYGPGFLVDVQKLAEGSGRRATVRFSQQDELQLHLELSLFLGILRVEGEGKER